MRRLAVVAASAVLFAFIPASTAAAQAAVGAACSAPMFQPGAPMGPYQCVYGGPGWSQPYPGEWLLVEPSWTADQITWAGAQFQFNDGRLYRAEFYWPGSLEALKAQLGARRGAYSDLSGEDLTYFLLYEQDPGDGWAVRVGDAETTDGYVVTYVSRH